MTTERLEELRRKAELKLSERESQIERMDQADLKSLAHELAVHQVELEIQNEELRRTRLEAEAARDRYLDLFDFAPVGYFTLDEHNRVVEANLTGCQLLKTDRKSLLRQSFTKFISTEESNRFYLQRRKALESGVRQTGELQMQKADGTPFYAQIESLKVGDERLRLAVIDITERKKLDQLKDDFIGMVSHELRTPLTIFLGAVKTAMSEGIAKEQIKELLKDASHSADSMAHLVDNLLELSLYEANRLTFSQNQLDIANVIRDVIEKERIHLENHQFSLEIAEGLPPVDADQLRLELIILNLLDNAAKYSPDHTEIRVSVKHDGDHLLIGVKDEGKGISSEDQYKLFLSFERLHETSATRPGLGLGLLVCKRLVETQGGKIWVESEPGKGSTFWLTLPLKRRSS